MSAIRLSSLSVPDCRKQISYTSRSRGMDRLLYRCNCSERLRILSVAKNPKLTVKWGCYRRQIVRRYRGKSRKRLAPVTRVADSVNIAFHAKLNLSLQRAGITCRWSFGDQTVADIKWFPVKIVSCVLCVLCSNRKSTSQKIATVSDSLVDGSARLTWLIDKVNAVAHLEGVCWVWTSSLGLFNVLKRRIFNCIVLNAQYTEHNCSDRRNPIPTPTSTPTPEKSWVRCCGEWKAFYPWMWRARPESYSCCCCEAYCEFMKNLLLV